MKGITQEDVLEILRMMEESEFDELHLEMGELKLIVNKSAGRGGTALTSDRAHEKPLRSEAVEKPPVPLREQKEDAALSAETDDAGLVAIKAPMLGTFYTSPKPGAPPFVKAGQYIKEDDTVCIIEVMKLFSTVKAGVRGRVSKILAENSQMVEYNQTLFLVEQDQAEDKGAEGRS